jgi:hypothetical protein
MASNDPGIIPKPVDPPKDIERVEQVHEPIAAPEDGGDPPVAPDQFDPKWETSRWEIWAYYTYYSLSF